MLHHMKIGDDIIVNNATNVCKNKTSNMVLPNNKRKYRMNLYGMIWFTFTNIDSHSSNNRAAFTYKQASYGKNQVVSESYLQPIICF